MKNLISHLKTAQQENMKTNKDFEESLRKQMFAIAHACESMENDLTDFIKENSSGGFSTIHPTELQLRKLNNQIELFNMSFISLTSVLGELVKRFPETPNGPVEDKDAIIAGQQSTMKRLSEEMHHAITKAHNTESDNLKLKQMIHQMKNKMKDLDPAFNETFMKNFKDLLA